MTSRRTRLRLRLRRRLREPARVATTVGQSTVDARRRLRRSLRAGRGRARLVASVLAACRQGHSAVLVLDDLRALTPSMRRTLQAARLAGADVEVAVLDFKPNVDVKIGRRLPVHRFWTDAAPAGGGAPARHSVDGLVPGRVEGPGEQWLDGWYSDGKPVYAMSGAVVECYDASGRVARSEQLDADGALVRIVDRYPSTGKATTHRYLDADGRCWLSVWITAKGSFGRTQQHVGDQREYPTMRVAQAQWLRSRVGDARLFAGGRAATKVVGLTKS